MSSTEPITNFNRPGPPEPPAPPGPAPDAPVHPLRLLSDGAAGEPLPVAVQPHPVPPDAELDHPSLYFNRELSWIDFNWRVLWQAMDARTPLLERIRFLAITQSNLDEFFGKRIGGLIRQRAAGVSQLSPDGRTPDEQLALVRTAVAVMQSAMSAVWTRELRPQLAAQAGVIVHDYTTLDDVQRAWLADFFRTAIFPILTPLGVDPGHPFPFISNLSQSLAVVLRNTARGTDHFARVKIPMTRGRLIALPEPLQFVPIEEVVRHHAAELFPGMEVHSASLFRVLRSAEITLEEDEASDLLEMISEELRERKFAPVVRVEVEPAMDASVRELLVRELEIDAAELYEVAGMQDFTGIGALANLDLPAFRYEPWEPIIPGRLAHERESDDAVDIFAIIRQGDLLVHHPYDSFAGSVQRFLEEAAVDPRVLAIKQTLYRTSENSPVVRALVRAAEHGKQVAVLIELMARFDEERNIEWAQELERAGVHVAYGVIGLKTHAKVALVVREEEHGIATYCHIGTGNYHPTTARLYSDVGLLTAAPDIGRDIVNLFHSITGYAPQQTYAQLLVAPDRMRQAFHEEVEREIEQQRAHGDGRIVLKMNALDDVDMIRALYRASRAGVRVDLIVRGHTRLRPGVAGVSDNIRVISIVGRFLEHERIFLFHNHGDARVFIGSADWRHRNLDERVEAVVRVQDPAARARLERILAWSLEDNRLAWDLGADGAYVLRRPAGGEEDRNLHERLMREAREERGATDAAWKRGPAAG